MIKYIIGSALILSSFSSIAQKEDKVITKPTEGSFGASIVLNGLIDNISFETNQNNFSQNILFAKYYLKDDLVLRMGFGITSNNASTKSSSTQNEIVTEIDSSANQTVLNLSGGIEKHLSGTKRLDPFVFAQMDLSFIGKLNFETETRTTSSVGTTTLGRDLTQDGGLGFALNFGGGFNYFLANNFSIGSELFFGLRYARQGGTTSITDTETDVNGNITSAFDERDESVSETTIAVNPAAVINVSYFF